MTRFQSCWIQRSHALLPHSVMPTSSSNPFGKAPTKDDLQNCEFPCLDAQNRLGEARNNTREALRKGTPPVVIAVDISFNEPMQQIQVLELTGGQKLSAYGFAISSQRNIAPFFNKVPRNRNRPQDTYDLDFLIANNEIDDALCAQIFGIFIAKCQSRQLEPTRASLDDPKIKERASNGWQAMKLELGELPDFEGCFERVSDFYRNLPWNSK